MKSLTMTRRAFACAAGAVAAVGTIAATGCGQEQKAAPARPKISVCIDRAPTPYLVGIYVAKHRGLLGEDGLDIEIAQTDLGTSSVECVHAGWTQFGVASQEQLAEAFSAERPASVMAVAGITQHATDGLLCLRKSKIRGFTDLPKREFAACDTYVGNKTVEQLVRAGDGNPDKVLVAARRGRDQSAASVLVDDGIDAMWGSRGWDYPVLEQAGAHPSFVLARQVMSVLDCCTPAIIANDTYLIRHADESRAFLDALRRGYRYAARHPREAADILCAEVPQLDSKTVRSSLAYLASCFLDRDGDWGVIAQGRWDAYFSWLYDRKFIEREIPWHHGYTNDYLRDAKD